MNREEKRQFVSDLRDRLEKAQGTFLMHYQGLKVDDINRLRNELRTIGVEFQVVKNRLLKLACEGTETESIKDEMQGPSAIALTYDDVVGPAKTLVNFAKDFNQLEVKKGQVSGKVIDANDIKQLAKLPSREILLAQALAAMQAVPAGFVRVVGGVMGQLMNVLKAIEQQKEAA
jgi:large subunit ribosomal protein L10